MKKSFFKKLSFILALAMIVSTIAPAAGAFAAAKPALSVTGKYLLLGETGKSSYDFNFKKSTVVSGCKYAWSSSKTAVATVNSDGLVKAKKAGTTYVYCKVTKAGKVLTTAKAKVIVLSNIKTAAITDPGTVGVNKATNLELTYTTFSGATAGATSYVTWAVSGAGATVTDKGVFTATLPGTYTVTAKAFSTKNSTAVKATAEKNITVEAAVVETKQVDADTFTVKFDCDMSKTDIKTASTLFQIVAGKALSTGAEKIKKIELSADGTTATVDAYASFTGGNTYNLVFGKLTASFTAAKKDHKFIAGINFADFNVVPGATPTKDMLEAVSAYDANGVTIYTGAELASYLTFTYGGDYTKGSIAGTGAYIYAVGNTAKITVKFADTVYDDTSKTWKPLSLTDDAIATGVANDTSIVTTSLAYSLPLTSSTTAAKDLTYATTGLTVAAKDANKIAVKYAVTNDANTVRYDAVGADTHDFRFKSTDTDKLITSTTGNLLYPVKEGTVTVLVYDYANASSPVVVGSFDVTIVAARAFGGITLDNNYIMVGNSTGDTVGTTATVSAVDTLGSALVNAAASVELVSPIAAPGVTYPSVTCAGLSGTDGKIKIKAFGYSVPGGVAATASAFTYKIKVTSNNVTKEIPFTVEVKDTTGTANNAVRYALELESSAVDLKNVTGKAISVALYGYNSNGVRLRAVTADNYVVTVKDANGNAPINGNTSTSITLVANNGGTFVATPDAVGAYTVTAVASGAGAGAQIFISGSAAPVVSGTQLSVVPLTLTDSTTKSGQITTPIVSATSVSGAICKAMTLTMDGNTLDGSTITAVDVAINGAAVTTISGTPALVASSLVSGNTLHVVNVYLNKVQDGYSINYKYEVGGSITIQ